MVLFDRRELSVELFYPVLVLKQQSVVLLGSGVDALDLMLVLQEGLKQLIMLSAQACNLLLQILEHCVDDLKVALQPCLLERKSEQVGSVDFHE